MTKGNDLATIRDTTVSIWVAIILAFVLRAFVLEAFVIPTGSMAPRLMGRHMLLTCPDCRFEFPFGLSEDAPKKARCPNCREEFSWERNGHAHNGDRVLVLKYLYRFREPRRWDVVVFKNPQTNEENYIKRLVGLPGEVVRIIHGDLFYYPIADNNGDGVRDKRDLVTPVDQISTWRIARKSHETQEAMWQLLFDNDYRPADVDRAVPWVEPWTQTPGDEAWTLTEQAPDGTTRRSRVFRYQGLGPRILRFADTDGQRERFEAVNAYNGARNPTIPSGFNTCSDLKLETTLVPRAAAGSLLLTLSNFGHEFAAEISFDGRIRLLHRKLNAGGGAARSWDQAESWGERRRAAFPVGRSVPVAITHADWRVTVWIDGQPALVSTDEQYSPPVDELVDAVRHASSALPMFEPRVRIIGQAGQFELWHTRVWRDVFYTCPPFGNGYANSALFDYAGEYFANQVQSGQPGWGTMANPLVLRAHDDQPDLDEFFMLGDNSPSSLDSRLWVKAAPTLRLFDENRKPQYRLGTVPRYNLIGKAFFVYWPSGHDLPLPWHLPIVPNAGKMRRIR